MEVAHSFRDATERRPQDEVVVRPEQTRRVDLPALSLCRPAEPHHELLAVDVVLEDREAVNAVGGEVVELVGVEGARLAAHPSIVPGERCNADRDKSARSSNRCQTPAVSDTDAIHTRV